MTLKFTAGLIILFIALTLQFLLASAHIYAALSFAALISFAFIFEIWELITLILLAVFIVNWAPVVSVEILVFALYPLAVHFSRGVVHWEAWLANLFAIVLGFLALYLLVLGKNFLAHPGAFFVDVGLSLIWSVIIFAPMYHWERR